MRQWDHMTQFRIVTLLARLAPGRILDLPPAINDRSLSPVDVVVLPFVESATTEMNRYGAVLALVAWMDAICASETHPDHQHPPTVVVSSESAPISDPVMARFLADAAMMGATLSARWAEMVRSWRATRLL